MKDTKKYIISEKKLLELISSLEHNDKLPTFRKLMEMLDVSQSTLDRTLFRLEKNGLIFKKQGSGIYVNKPNNGTKRTIGAVFSDITDRFESHLVKGVEEVLGRHGYRLLLCHGHEELQKEIKAIEALKKDIDGLIIHPIHTNLMNPEYVKFFKELQTRETIPITFVENMLPDAKGKFAGFNQFDAFANITRQISQKNENAEYVLWGYLGSYIGCERLYGFKTGIRTSKVPAENIRILNIDAHYPSENIPWDKLFSGKKKTFFFVTSPLLLPKLGKELIRRRIKPHQVIPVCVVEEDYKDYINIPVIAMTKPAVKLGREAAMAAIGAIHGVDGSYSVRLDLDLEIPEIYMRYV